MCESGQSPRRFPCGVHGCPVSQQLTVDLPVFLRQSCATERANGHEFCEDFLLNVQCGTVMRLAYVQALSTVSRFGLLGQCTDKVFHQVAYVCGQRAK